MPSLASDTDLDTQLGQLRKTHPVFRIGETTALWDEGTLRLEFSFACGPHKFDPVVQFRGLQPREADKACTTTAKRLARALSIVEAFSYWKAFCSPVIEVMQESPGEGEVAWWNDFWPKAMGEFFYRNGIDYTSSDFLRITAPQSPGSSGQPAPEEAPAAGELPPPLVMFSGGKDSLALTFVIRPDESSPADFFLYNPTPGQNALAGSLSQGGRILEVRREILPELLALNADGHPNGHTPYSAYLAIAALLLGYLRGSTMVLAGNSRSDDEPNISSYLGRPVNHQWTKSHEFESALRNYTDRWLPGAPVYNSPMRPLFELQIIQSLSAHVDNYMQTASCNRMKGAGWCLTCAKCAWVFLATSALFGHDLAVRKTGGDMFANPALAELFERMAGLTGTKPFECTGTEQEVRAAIQAIGNKLGDDLPALASSLRCGKVTGARPLDELLDDWGQDDLVPDELKTRIRHAVHAG